MSSSCDWVRCADTYQTETFCATINLLTSISIHMSSHVQSYTCWRKCILHKYSFLKRNFAIMILSYPSEKYGPLCLFSFWLFQKCFIRAVCMTVLLPLFPCDWAWLEFLCPYDTLCILFASRIMLSIRP